MEHAKTCDTNYVTNLHTSVVHLHDTTFHTLPFQTFHYIKLISETYEIY